MVVCGNPDYGKSKNRFNGGNSLHRSLRSVRLGTVLRRFVSFMENLNHRTGILLCASFLEMGLKLQFGSPCPLLLQQERIASTDLIFATLHSDSLRLYILLGKDRAGRRHTQCKQPENEVHFQAPRLICVSATLRIASLYLT